MNGEKLVTVSSAANMCNTIPQKLHKAIRDEDLITYPDPRSNKRMVDIDEVRAFMAGAPGRGRPAKEITMSVDGLHVGAVIVRQRVREVMRDVHTITGESIGHYAMLTSNDPEGMKDAWRKEDVKQMMEKDECFVMDRWRMLVVLAESFKVTGDNEMHKILTDLSHEYREDSEIKMQSFLERQLEKQKLAEEIRKRELQDARDRREQEASF